MASKRAKERLMVDAGLRHPPTDLTYNYRRAMMGKGPLAYQWSDKPHRLVHNLCRIIEEIAALSQ